MQGAFFSGKLPHPHPPKFIPNNAPIASPLSARAALKAIRIARRVGLSRRWLVEQPAQVDNSCAAERSLN